MTVNFDKLNVFLRKFVRDLRADAEILVNGEKLGWRKALAEGPPELSRTETVGMDVARRARTPSDTKFSENCETCWWKGHRLFDLRQRVIAAALLGCALFPGSPSYSEGISNYDDRLVLELSTLGKHGDVIARARGQVLNILQHTNACTAWFQEADPEPAEVFRSLHYEMETIGPSYVYAIRSSDGRESFKHPWGARSIENGGRNSTILLNAQGPFFNRTSEIMLLDPRGILARPDGMRLLTVSSYGGNTLEAQIMIFLHELGHITGRLPEDNDSWDGRSSRNTSEVERHCKAEIRTAAHTRHISGQLFSNRVLHGRQPLDSITLSAP